VKQLLNTLYVSTDGAYLRLEGETLVLSVEKVKKHQVPLVSVHALY
jgi:CRISPR-associated protein Cas1